MTNPGLIDPLGAHPGRLTLRVTGALLFLTGMAAIVVGAIVFARAFLADTIDAMGHDGLVGVLVFGGGGILAVLGAALLSAGFAGSWTRYVATEAMSVVRDPAALFVDDDRPVE